MSKTILARDLKLGQLIVDNEQITWLTFEQMLPIFSGVVDLCTEHFSLVSKIWASGLKRGWWVDYLFNFSAKSIFLCGNKALCKLGRI